MAGRKCSHYNSCIMSSCLSTSSWGSVFRITFFFLWNLRHFSPYGSTPAIGVALYFRVIRLCIPFLWTQYLRKIHSGNLSKFGTNIYKDKLIWIWRPKVKRSRLSHSHERDISGTPGGNFLRPWHKYRLGLVDELIPMWWSMVTESSGLFHSHDCYIWGTHEGNFFKFGTQRLADSEL